MLVETYRKSFIPISKRKNEIDLSKPFWIIDPKNLGVYEIMGTWEEMISISIDASKKGFIVAQFEVSDEKYHGMCEINLNGKRIRANYNSDDTLYCFLKRYGLI